MNKSQKHKLAAMFGEQSGSTGLPTEILYLEEQIKGLSNMVKSPKLPKEFVTDLKETIETLKEVKALITKSKTPAGGASKS